MANFIRSPKSGSDWGRNELRAYNIVIVPETVAAFFGNAQLPPSTINPEILAHVAYPAAGLPSDERLFFDLLEEAMLPPPGDLKESAEDKQYLEGKDPEPQLIAEAIAAFQSRNNRLSRAGLPTVNATVIPGITMAGTAPTFYKVNITTALVNAVETGEYPSQATTVHKLIPPVQSRWDFERDGMRPLNNRAVILSCFEAFKQFL
ncbi:hypothetical protein JOM56_005569 [Amanita muscaria]